MENINNINKSTNIIVSAEKKHIHETCNMKKNTNINIKTNAKIN